MTEVKNREPTAASSAQDNAQLGAGALIVLGLVVLTGVAMLIFGGLLLF